MHFRLKQMELLMHEEIKNKEIVKFCQLKFENHISTKSFGRLLRDTYITTRKMYPCN